MEGVEEVRQLDDKHLHWRRDRRQRAGVGRRDHRAAPRRARRLARHRGIEHAGVVTFHRVDERRTRVMLQLDVEPEGVVEKVGDGSAWSSAASRATSSASRSCIEGRGTETGAWRGEVDQSATR